MSDKLQQHQKGEPAAEPDKGKVIHNGEKGHVDNVGDTADIVGNPAAFDELQGTDSLKVDSFGTDQVHAVVREGEDMGAQDAEQLVGMEQELDMHVAHTVGLDTVAGIGRENKIAEIGPELADTVELGDIDHRLVDLDHVGIGGVVQVGKFGVRAEGIDIDSRSLGCIADIDHELVAGKQLDVVD